MRIQIISNGITYTIGVADGYDIQLGYEGGPEPHYGSRIQVHSAGVKKASGSLSRWFFTDTNQEDLLLNLFQAETSFTLSGSLQDNSGTPIPNTTVTLSDFRLYKWRPKTGAANDIIGEESSGEATDWVISVVKTA
jgi:hypothetical protein